MRSRAVLRKHLSEGGECRLVGHVDVGTGSAGPGATATAAAAPAACREKKNDRVNGLNKKKIHGARNPREGIRQWMEHRKRYQASEGGGGQGQDRHLRVHRHVHRGHRRCGDDRPGRGHGAPSRRGGEPT